MNLTIGFPGAELRGFSEDFRRGLAREFTREMRTTAEDLRQALRNDTAAAGLGKLAPTWQRPRVYPEGREHISPGAIVSSKAPLPMRAFTEGAVIRGKGGGWLAIPTPQVAKMRGFASVESKAGGGLAGVGPRRARITPAGFVAATGLHLRMVYQSSKRAFLVASGVGAGRSRLGVRRLTARERARGRAATAEFIAFFLIPQAVIRKRIDAAGRTRTAGSLLQSRLVAAVERAAGAAAQRNKGT